MKRIITVAIKEPSDVRVFRDVVEFQIRTDGNLVLQQVGYKSTYTFTVIKGDSYSWFQDKMVGDKENEDESIATYKNDEHDKISPEEAFARDIDGTWCDYVGKLFGIDVSRSPEKSADSGR